MSNLLGHLRRQFLRLLRAGGSGSNVAGSNSYLIGVTPMKKNIKNSSDREGKMVCKDSRTESKADQEYRERVRAVSTRVREENRHILNRLATK